MGGKNSSMGNCTLRKMAQGSSSLLPGLMTWAWQRWLPDVPVYLDRYDEKRYSVDVESVARTVVRH